MRHNPQSRCYLLLLRLSRCAQGCRYTDDAAHTAYTGSPKYLKMEREAVGDDMFDWVRICNKFRCQSLPTIAGPPLDACLCEKP